MHISCFFEEKLCNFDSSYNSSYFLVVEGRNHPGWNTLSMFYKQQSDLETSWQVSNFDSRCLAVAYFLLKIQYSRCLFFCSKFKKFHVFCDFFFHIMTKHHTILILETSITVLSGLIRDFEVSKLNKFLLLVYLRKPSTFMLLR